jgi:hypothetical protein
MAVNQRNKLENDIENLSAKLSDMQSSISSIDSNLSNLPSHKRPRRLTNLEEQLSWSCDALSGIDDAFIHDPIKGHSECIFCGMLFVWDDAGSFVRQGRHVALQHDYGQCNLAIRYHSITHFNEHLESFHNYDTSRHTPWERILDRFKKSGGKNMLFPKSWKSNGHPDRVVREETTSFLVIISQITELLCDFGMLQTSELHIQHQHDKTRNGNTSRQEFYTLYTTLAKLDDEAYSSMLAGSYGEATYARLCLLTACHQEDLVVLGFEDILHYETYFSPSQCELQGFTIMHHETVPPETLNSRWHVTSAKTEFTFEPGELIFPTIGAYAMRSIWVERILNRSFDGLKDEYEVNQYIQDSRNTLTRTSHGFKDCSISRGNFLQLRHMGGSYNDLEGRVDMWLFGVFLKSISVRRILRGAQVLTQISHSMPQGWLRDATGLFLDASPALGRTHAALSKSTIAATFSGYSFEECSNMVAEAEQRVDIRVRALRSSASLFSPPYES